MQHTASALQNRLLARGKFRHVQVLLKLAELGSVQRTADAIGMTQSSVTQTLAYLEGLLDTPLFERHARGVRPTPACTDLLPLARQLMEGLAQSADVVAARHRRGTGLVRLIGSAAATNGLLVEALPAFSDRYPQIQVLLHEAEGEDQLLAITRGEVDLVACRHPAVAPEGWEFYPLREDRFAVVCRPAHPLARRRRLQWATLAGHPWLLLPAGLAARTQFDEIAMRFAEPPPTYPVVTRSLTLLGALLRQRDLLALLPLNLVRPMLQAGELVELPGLAGVPLRPLGLMQPRREIGEAARLLAEFLRG